jgi:hypothetical protein
MAGKTVSRPDSSRAVTLTVPPGSSPCAMPLMLNVSVPVSPSDVRSAPGP